MHRKLGHQHDRTPQPGQPQAQADILDHLLLGPKSPDSIEIGPAQRAAAGPEGRGRPCRTLMNMVMQQVAQATDARRCRRRIVIASEQPGMARIA